VSLAEIQRFLASALRREAPIPDDPGVAAIARAHVAGNDRLSPVEQADIYREQFWLRHVAALTEDYPTVRALLGEDAFDRLLHGYLTAHPPRTPSLRELGADIAPFASTWDGWSSLPEGTRERALELLAYEQCFIDLFDGPDVPPLDAKKLASVSEDAWERARLVTNPVLARLHLRWPVHLFRIALMEAGDGEPPVFPAARDVSLVLYRVEWTIRYDEVEPAALALLDALAAGEPLGAACERVAGALAAEEAESFGDKVGPWFQDWTAKGWIVDVVV
jgi:hypothetical protein